MLESLNVPAEKSKAALDVIHQNLEWKRTEAANQINIWIHDRLGSSTSSELPVTDSPTVPTSTESTTLAGSKMIFSTILGLSCAVMRMVL